MAKDIGEEIVGAWLSAIKKCDFVQYNIPTQKQGEIDVIGLNLASDTLYICEVATHLDGLLYVGKNNENANQSAIVKKFTNICEFLKDERFKRFHKVFQFWSPIVKEKANADLEVVKAKMKLDYQVDIEMIINLAYLEKLEELKTSANEKTAASEYPVLRLLQVLGKLEKLRRE